MRSGPPEETLQQVQEHYPIALTRDLTTARRWLRSKARGSERYGIVVSSQAERLKPYAVDVKTPVNPVHWFLNGKDDVRSSYYLEDVATEFHVQGLEVDWACVVWDADFRFTRRGLAALVLSRHRMAAHPRSREARISQECLSSPLDAGSAGDGRGRAARGDAEDPTRPSAYYDQTFDYLSSSGMSLV